MVWGTYPEMKLLDRIILFLILEEPKYCFPTRPYHCTSPPAAYKDSNSSTSYPTRPPGALSYSLTQSFSKYLYKTYRTPEAGDTVRNKMDSACPWEACNLPRNRDSEQTTGGMNIKKKKKRCAVSYINEALYPKDFTALHSVNAWNFLSWRYYLRWQVQPLNRF